MQARQPFLYVAVCCSAWQCVASCCSMYISYLWQLDVQTRQWLLYLCCSVLQRVTACCSMHISYLVTAWCARETIVSVSVLQRVAACCSVLQRVAVCSSVLQYVYIIPCDNLTCRLDNGFWTCSSVLITCLFLLRVCGCVCERICSVSCPLTWYPAVCCVCVFAVCVCVRWYGVATISRLLKIIGLFCKRDL